MATSSIFTNIVINEPKKVEKFIEALETSSHDPAWKPTTPVKPPLTDIEAIRKLRILKLKVLPNKTHWNLQSEKCRLHIW